MSASARKRPWSRRRWVIVGMQVAILLVVLVAWELGARTRYDEEHFLIDPFQVGIRRPDGRWTVVRPQPAFGLNAS